MDIKTKIRSFPAIPGIYIFKDAQNAIIYVGKALSLKSRVASYFQKKETLDPKIRALREEAFDADYVPTNNETEALLLEAELVKKLQPKYNILLKEGQPLLYLIITDEKLPEFKIVRNKKLKGTYFGPFIKKTPVRSIHAFLTKKFNLKLCNKKISGGCLQYHMGNCAGTCRADFDQEDYKFRLELVKKILNNNHQDFKQDILQKIESYNRLHEFEKAKKLHSYLESLDQIINTVKLHFSFEKFVPQVELAQMHSYPIPDRTLATKLKDFLQLPIEPHSIDCFDISHFQGQAMVGSCVRFHDGMPIKNLFRHFKIKTIHQQDDYAALAEIVSRRYKDNTTIPNLIMIDGGKGQLSTIQSLNLPCECISLAKREERIFSTAFPDGKVLDITTDVGRLLIMIRDYAHHFAISYHRTRRSKFSQTLS